MTDKNVIGLDGEIPFHLDPKFESAIMQKISGGSFNEWKLWFSFTRNKIEHLIWVGSTGGGLIQCEATVTDEYGVKAVAESGIYYTDCFKMITNMVSQAIKYAHHDLFKNNPTVVYSVAIRHAFDYEWDWLYTYVARTWGEFEKPTHPQYAHWGWQHTEDGKLTDKQMMDMGMDSITLQVLEDRMYEGHDEIEEFGSGDESDAQWYLIRK